VKVVLGFLELALAFKFLSNADMTWDTHMLERELFLAVWIAIFAVLTLYLFGKIKMPHDSPVENLSVGRVLLGTTTLLFVIYMIPGMWGAPLQIISAFPPPMEYSESPLGIGGGGAASESTGPEGTVRGPQNLWVFHDYDKALAYAKEVNKPLFVDFTGINCVNCRRMEQKVWGEEGIIESLKNDVVIVSLHVDERKALPKKEQGVFTVGGRKREVRTTGDKWKLMQIKRYKNLTQPYYVMQDPNGKDLGNGSADFEHTSDPKDFKKWLDNGLSEFSKNK
jgi:thiol:disulfide interchange protein DsbD